MFVKIILTPAFAVVILTDRKLLHMKRNPFSVGRVILTLLLSLISGSLMAQKVKLDTLTVEALNLYKHKAVKMRNTGIIITFSGLGIVAASYIVGNHIANIPSDDPLDPNKNELKGFAVGLTSGIAGLAAIAAGIYLKAIGENRYFKVELTLQRLNNLPDNSSALGVGIKLRF